MEVKKTGWASSRKVSKFVTLRRQEEIKVEIFKKPTPKNWKPAVGDIVIAPKTVTEYYTDDSGVQQSVVINTLRARTRYAVIISARMIDPDFVLIADNEFPKSRRKVLVKELRPATGMEFDKPVKVKAKRPAKKIRKKSSENK
jgi:hypothetical protein